MYPVATCPNERRILDALHLEAPDKIPSFCQSIMGALTRAYLAEHEEDITDDDVLLTQIGDLTLYKAFGYSSHWCGKPHVTVTVDTPWRDRVAEMVAEIHARGKKNWGVNQLGSIRASNAVTHWFVEAGIKNEADLRLMLDNVSLQPPDAKQVEQWREGRLQCLRADFVPFISPHVVMEPANQSISFGLTARLMRRNPALLEEFYDFLTRIAEHEIEAGIKANYKTFCTADDCAYKTGPMISPKQYRRFVTPCATRLCDLVHAAGGVIFMHTDGFIDPIMDCFIDAGYDAIQPLEPTSGMTIERVKRLWGDQLACIGNVDTTTTLSFGTPADARAYVHRCFREARGKDDEIKGYVFAASGSLHDEVKLENALAMMDEYAKVRDGLVPI